MASLIVELGEYDISGNTEYMPTRQMKVKRVVVHKDYQAPTFENDIAILELVSFEILHLKVTFCSRKYNATVILNMKF